MSKNNWKANLKQLRIALDRMTQNYSVHADCSKEEAISVAEGILAQLRKKTHKGKSPYSLGPLDPTKTDLDDEREDS